MNDSQPTLCVGVGPLLPSERMARVRHGMKVGRHGMKVDRMARKTGHRTHKSHAGSR
jgi:hypothetical protein